MGTFLRAPVLIVFRLLSLGVCLSAPLAAAAQPPASDPPVSLERIREELEKAPTPGLNLDVDLLIPVATFKTRVDQRAFVLTFEEWLSKEFEMDVFERQSAAWRSKCCGINLGQLTKRIERALRNREVRQIREQIARELAELEARKQQEATTKK